VAAVRLPRWRLHRRARGREALDARLLDHVASQCSKTSSAHCASSGGWIESGAERERAARLGSPPSQGSMGLLANAKTHMSCSQVSPIWR
jgi:hypothetical protein